MRIQTWRKRQTVCRATGIAVLAVIATVLFYCLFSGIAKAQVSLSGDFRNKTLNFGKGVQGDEMLTVQIDQGQAQATGGVTVTEGDKVSFDSHGGQTNTPGYWKGENNKTYRILLSYGQKTPTPEGPRVGDDQVWVAVRPSPNGDRIIITHGPDGTEIMPLFLQEITWEREPRTATAIVEVRGLVRWSMDRNVTDGKDNLLTIAAGGRHFLAITGRAIQNGTLYISSADGSKYKVYNLSCDFTGTIDKVPDAPSMMPAISSSAKAPTQPLNVQLTDPSATTSKQAVIPAHPAIKPANPARQVPEPSDKVVLKVGAQQFTKADIDLLIDNLNPQAQRVIATRGRKSLGDQYALIIALSEQAHLHHLDQSYEFIHKLAIQRQQSEAQIAIEEINARANVTSTEVHQYYTAHAADYDEIAVRQFVIRKMVVNSRSDPGHPVALTGLGLAPEEAKSRADAIRKELVAGNNIKNVLAEFEAPGDVIIDAEPRTVRRGGMREDMEKVAFGLKDGEVSEPFDALQALVFFQVTNHSHSGLKDVTAEIEKKLRQQKIDASMDAVKKSANVWMDEIYFAEKP